jgi:hypothetical protein
MERARVILLVALGGALFAARAAAQDGARVALEWTADADCPDAARVRAGVEERLERSAFVAAGAEHDVLVAGTIAREADEHVARIVLSTSTRETTSETSEPETLGERELRTRASCLELEVPVAVVVALLVEHARRRVVMRVPEPPPQPAPVGIDPIDPIDPIEPIDPMSVVSPPGWTAELAAGALLSFGRLPSVAAGARVTAAVRFPELFALELEGAGFPGGARAEIAEGGAETSAATIAVIAWLAWRAAAVEIGGGVGADVGVLRVVGDGFAADVREDRIIAGLSARLRGLVWLAGPVALRLEGALIVPLSTPSLVYGAVGGRESLLWVAPPVAGQLALDLAFVLPRGS